MLRPQIWCWKWSSFDWVFMANLSKKHKKWIWLHKHWKKEQKENKSFQKKISQKHFLHNRFLTNFGRFIAKFWFSSFLQLFVEMFAHVSFNQQFLSQGGPRAGRTDQSNSEYLCLSHPCIQDREAIIKRSEKSEACSERLEANSKKSVLKDFPSDDYYSICHCGSFCETEREKL